MALNTLSDSFSSYTIQFVNKQVTHLLSTYQQNVFDATVWLPVLLQSINTYGTITSHIGVKYLGYKEPYIEGTGNGSPFMETDQGRVPLLASHLVEEKLGNHGQAPASS